jgi:hypothetical protein
MHDRRDSQGRAHENQVAPRTRRPVGRAGKTMSSLNLAKGTTPEGRIAAWTPRAPKRKP